MTTTIQHLPRTSQQIWLAAIIASAIGHFAIVGGISPHQAPTKPDYSKIPIRVNEMPKPTVAPELEKVKPKPPKPDKPKPPPPNQQTKVPVKPDTPPIQGLTKESLSDKGTIAAPAGNTMMTEDSGKRLNPNDVNQIAGDLSAPASLVRTSITVPPYTEQALDAALEGTWIVDVFVNVDGSVKDAELRKKIGYGMDEKVLSAAKVARFIPRKNKLGVSEPGWAEIKFTLVIP